MAHFREALTKTLRWEGNYGCDKMDRGGETWKGVSRKNFPTWEGWQIVDALRGQQDFPLCLLYNQQLQIDVERFYLQNFWNVLKADEIESQPLAEKLFDVAVNMGVGRAVKFLQQAINGTEETGISLNEDGMMGSKTLSAIKEYVLLVEGGYSQLIATIRVLQQGKYRDIVARDKTQEKFLNGWLNRAMA